MLQKRTCVVQFRLHGVWGAAMTVCAAAMTAECNNAVAGGWAARKGCAGWAAWVLGIDPGESRGMGGAQMEGGASWGQVGRAR